MSAVVAKGETRGLAAALAGPAFLPRATTESLAGADRHMSRWAPESSAVLPRSLQTVAFADRLVAPLFSAASKMGGLRMFSDYQSDGFRERQVASGGWLFPKPWYQDELRWLAAARMQPRSSDAMFTTRGTFASRDNGPGPFEQSVPPELFPYVAPSLAGGGESYSASAIDAWSPSVSAPSMSAARMYASLGASLSSTLSPSARSGDVANTAGRSPQMTALAASVRTALAVPAVHTLPAAQSRLANLAPEMVTPPAPRRATASINDNGSVANLEYREQLAAQRAVVQQRLHELAAQVQPASDTGASVGNAAAQNTVAWDQVVQTQPAVGERQGQAKSLARQHVELLAQSEPASQRVTGVVNRSATSEGNQAIANTDASQVSAQNLDDRDSNEQAQPLAAMAATNQGPAPTGAEVATLRTLDVSKLAQLVEQLRFAELVAAADTTRGGSVAVQGPQLVMPAGLGGLASTVAAATRSRFASNNLNPSFGVTGATAMPGVSMPGSGGGLGAGNDFAAVQPVRSALTSIGDAAPRALAHVAWSDRWLGRFAGAAPEQLTSFATATAAASISSTRGERAPATIFVAPRSTAIAGARDAGLTLDSGSRPSTSGNATSLISAAMPTAAAPTTTGMGASVAPSSSASEGTRYDDDAETPDDVFAAIASSAASSRARQRGERNIAAAASIQPVQSVVAPVAPSLGGGEVATKAGYRPLAMQAPQVAGAGFAAGLSASPFAGGLRDAGMVSAESTAPTFDVRAMFTAALVEAFFRGEYADLAATVAASTPTLAGGGAGVGNSMAPRLVQDFAPTWLNPTAPRVTQGAAQRGRLSEDSIVNVNSPAAERGGVQAAAVGTGQASERNEKSQPSVTAVSEAGSTATPAEQVVRPTSTRIVQLAQDSSQLDQPGSYEVFELAVPAAFGGFESRSADSAVSGNQRIDYRPGAVGRSASAWLVSQQNTSTDLLLDFLPPELVVAAQSYGLSPQAALVAARLSAAGPAAIASLASQVDWAFLNAPSQRNSRLSNDVARESTESRFASTSTSNVAPGSDVSNVSGYGGRGEQLRGAETLAGFNEFSDRGDDNFALADATATINSLAPARQPRGAFLWPQATASALGIKAEALGAAGADSQSRFSIAALEVLAAKAVADLGAYAAPAALMQARGAAGVSPSGAPAMTNMLVGTSAQSVPFVDLSRRPDLLRSVLQAGSSSAGISGSSMSPQSDSADGAIDSYSAPQIVERVAAQLPAMQQQQFRALFLRGIGSPSVRAAQALALVHRSGVLAGNASLAERASLAWDAMPMLEVQKQLESAQGGFDLAALDALAASVANATSTVVIPNAPRLASALAALQSMVAPTMNGSAGNNNSAAPSASARAGDSLASLVTSNTSSAGAVRRAPTAAGEMVRTGARRSGEAEIPDWFEKAARKMFGEPSGTAADGLSMSDLTLINAAPPQQVAASTRGESVAPSAAPSVASATTEGGGGGTKIDVERTARDVYRAVLQIMEAARARNGEPYL